MDDLYTIESHIYYLRKTKEDLHPLCKEISL